MMTLLRIDRYFYGDFENPNGLYQPMLCQHCDNAPRERSPGSRHQPQPGNYQPDDLQTAASARGTAPTTALCQSPALQLV